MADQQPMYRAYTIIDREKDTPFWLNIGVAFAHKDTKGLNVMLQALPLNGKLVLRLYGEELEESKTETPLKTKKKSAASVDQQ
jgi:hypothetical protein